MVFSLSLFPPSIPLPRLYPELIYRHPITRVVLYIRVSLHLRDGNLVVIAKLFGEINFSTFLFILFCTFNNVLEIKR
jgi:hypothetical protein